jgi:hypothetical protein
LHAKGSRTGERETFFLSSRLPWPCMHASIIYQEEGGLERHGMTGGISSFSHIASFTGPSRAYKATKALSI